MPIERGRELAARIPGARFESFSSAGHLLHEDEPAEMATTLTTFILDAN